MNHSSPARDAETRRAVQTLLDLGRCAEIDAPLAECFLSPAWTPRLRRCAWAFLRVYKAELAMSGLDFGALSVPPSVGGPAAVRRRGLLSTSADQWFFEARFPAGAAPLAELQALPDWSYSAGENKWSVPALRYAPALALLRLAARRQMEVDETLVPALGVFREESATLETASRALDAPAVGVEGLARELYPFQRAGVGYLVAARRAILGDEMGLGKTAQALAAVEKMKGLPGVVVCPASLKLNWERELRAWTPGRAVFVLDAAACRLAEDGKTAWLPQAAESADWIVTNYETLAKDWPAAAFSLCGEHGEPYLDVAPRAGSALLREMAAEPRFRDYQFEQDLGPCGGKLFGVPLRDRDATAKLRALARAHKFPKLPKAAERAWRQHAGAPWPPRAGGRAMKGVFPVARALAALGKSAVFDEAHYLRGRKSQRRQAAAVVAATAEAVLLLSGTAVVNRPAEFWPLLGLLGREQQFGGWHAFSRRYCAAKETAFGWDVSGASNLDELNQELRRRCYIRRTKADALAELPEKTRSFVPVALSNPDEYQRASADLIGWLGQSAGASTADAAASAESLARVHHLAWLAAQGKTPAALAWLKNFLEAAPGEKLVVFAERRELVARLAEEFAAPRIMGGVSERARAEAVARFQEDPACRVIVGNLAAMGVGLTLTAASSVALLQFGWTPAALDQAEDRVHRIGQKQAANIYYLTAPGTIEEDILALIAEKREVVRGALDGRAPAQRPGAQRSVLEDLIRRMLEAGTEAAA